MQRSDLVLAEISTRNPNVYYELGLAYGLERCVILMHDENEKESFAGQDCIRESLDLRRHDHKVWKYPGIGMLGINDRKFKRSQVYHPQPHPRVAPKLQISILKVLRQDEPAIGSASLPPEYIGDQDNAPAEDIELKFNDVLSGVVGVAMEEIRAQLEPRRAQAVAPETDSAEPVDRWVEAFLALTSEERKMEWEAFKTAHEIPVDGKRDFSQIAAELSESFCTIIDVSGNDPVGCFWLGYCHARGLSAIPVYRVGAQRPEADQRETPHPQTGETNGHAPNLAFDIRALWYAEFDENKPYEFKNKVREVLGHLLERDLADRQKRAFWDRFPVESKLRLFIGAVHIDHPNREAVGDWDVRTVSELFSYLPSIREALALELVTPSYSPGQAMTAYRRSRPTIGEDEFIELYRQQIEEYLRDSNAIVIASPEVNPITEYLLHKIYRVRQPAQPFEGCDRGGFTGYVVRKEDSDFVTDLPETFPLYFFAREQPRENEPPKLGFVRQVGGQSEPGAEHLHPYWDWPQADIDKPLTTLGHLVIARYPLAPTSKNYVVLLNGVSGPATFGLAQLLTGGGGGAVHREPNMPFDSEMMLEEINQELDRENCVAVEAIVEVEIVPASHDARREGQPRATYVDNRQVKRWRYSVHPILID